MGYKSSTAYQWYWAGRGESGVRHDYLPAFKKRVEGQNTIVSVCAGEVYCRWGDGKKVTCGQNSRFSNETNLKNHVKKHKANGIPVLVESKRSGANSVDNETKASEFYLNLHQHVAYEEDEDDEVEEPEALATPKKPVDVAKSAANAAKKAAVGKMVLPVTKSAGPNNPAHAKLGEMRKMAGYQGQRKCTLCLQEKRDSCPPRTRPADPKCEIWDKFKVHPSEKKAEEHFAAAPGPSKRSRRSRKNKAAQVEEDEAEEAAGPVQQ